MTDYFKETGEKYRCSPESDTYISKEQLAWGESFFYLFGMVLVILAVIFSRKNIAKIVHIHKAKVPKIGRVSGGGKLIVILIMINFIGFVENLL